MCELQQENDRLRAELARLRQVQEPLQKRNRWLTTIAEVSNLLLRSRDYESVLPEVVRLLGEAVGSDRCGIGQNLIHPILNKPAIRVTSEWEWCKGEILSSEEFSPHLDRLFLEIDAPYITSKLSQGEVINCFVTDLPEPEHCLLAAQGNIAELFVPIWVNSENWGFIAFDNCSNQCLYDEAEIAFLKIAADSIAAAIERQAKDDELQKSEALYRSLFEINNEGIYRVEYEQPIPLSLSVDEQVQQVYQQFRIVQANDAYAAMYGLTRGEEMLGTLLTQLHIENSEKNQQFIRAMVEQGHQIRNMESEEIGLDGQARYFLNSGICFTENDRVTGGWGTQIDITALREAQSALLQAEQAKTAELAKINEDLRQREHLLYATGTVANILLTQDNFDQAVSTALQILGEGLKTDRTKVLEGVCEDRSRSALTHFTVTYEWTTSGTISQLTHPTSSKISIQDAKKFTQRFFPNDGFSGLLEEWDESLHSAFEAVGAKAIHAVPIRVDGEFWGVFAFDDCREAKRRSGTELAVLKMVANCIGSAIARQRTQKALLEAEQQRVTELAKTNQALRNSIDRLAADPDLNSFLGYVLLEINQQLNLDMASLRLYDPVTEALPLALEIEQGQVRLRHQVEAPEAYLYPSTTSTPVWEILLETKQPLAIDRNNAKEYVFQDTYEHQSTQMGLKVAVNLLLTLGNEPIGLLTLGSTQRTHFTPEELELAQALAQQATLAIQLTRLAEEAKQSALFEERNRMASEIHDVLAQAFTGISVQLELAQYLIHQNPTEVEQILDRIRKLAQTGLTEARRSVWSIYPTDEDYADLAQKLSDCLQHLTNGTSLQTDILLSGEVYPLSAFVGKNLLRIGQEAITNSLKHAHATRLWVELLYTPHQITLRVSDDGCGFSPHNQTEGFGLIGISERVDRIQGHLRITTQVNEGTKISVQVQT
jgi:PAS domain S-box-containing protein